MYGGVKLILQLNLEKLGRRRNIMEGEEAGWLLGSRNLASIVFFSTDSQSINQALFFFFTREKKIHIYISSTASPP